LPGLREKFYSFLSLGIEDFSETMAKKRIRTKRRKRDPLMVDGQYPRPLYVDYKDVELLKKLTNRQGKIVGRRKTGCSAVSQHVVTKAIKRARIMALLPFVGE
jgi:small subunit ribosomal protein S18